MGRGVVSVWAGPVAELSVLVFFLWGELLGEGLDWVSGERGGGITVSAGMLFPDSSSDAIDRLSASGSESVA